MNQTQKDSHVDNNYKFAIDSLQWYEKLQQPNVNHKIHPNSYWHSYMWQIGYIPNLN